MKYNRKVNLSNEIDIRWAVSEFAKDMERKFILNMDKGDPETGEELNLFDNLEKELEELKCELELDKKNSKDIINECADVANYAMMIASLFKIQHIVLNPHIST